MDLNKIFVKNCCPTKIGGMAILEGLMMRGSNAIAIAVRKPNGNIHLTLEPIPPKPKWMKVPILRGVVSFVDSLITGTTILFYGADLLEKWMEEDEEKEAFSKTDNAQASYSDAEKQKDTKEEKKESGLSQATIYASVILAIAVTVGLFILFPTFILSLIQKLGVSNVVLLNLIEGIIRICIFVAYIYLCTFSKDIKRTFEYHGAEHKTIHCYESGLELTPENAQQFYTLHPRCGTSFMMFVMIISLLIFSLFGWPNLWLRLLTRLLLIPVIAGISFEVLQFTGRHNNAVVKALSLPGIMLQKVTTRRPDYDELEVAIAAVKAVLPYHENPNVAVPYWVGEILPDGTKVKDEEATKAYMEEKLNKK